MKGTVIPVCCHPYAGIGLALAHEFVRHKAHVTLVARTAAKLKQAVQELQDAARAANGSQDVVQISYQAADVTQPKQVGQTQTQSSVIHTNARARTQVNTKA
jgi:NAD(P)-dependent dehydrogenase (short-subunit alcohol dehydrogenase family)